MFHCMYRHVWFIQSLVDGHLGGFHILTVVDDATVNMDLKIPL